MTLLLCAETGADLPLRRPVCLVVVLSTISRLKEWFFHFHLAEPHWLSSGRRLWCVTHTHTVFVDKLLRVIWRHLLRMDHSVHSVILYTSTEHWRVLVHIYYFFFFQDTDLHPVTAVRQVWGSSCFSGHFCFVLNMSPILIEHLMLFKIKSFWCSQTGGWMELLGDILDQMSFTSQKQFNSCIKIQA